MSLKLLKNFLKFKSFGLALFAAVYEVFGHEWKDGRLVCPHETYRLTIQQHVKGKLVGEIRAKTCVACDPGS